MSECPKCGRDAQVCKNCLEHDMNNLFATIIGIASFHENASDPRLVRHMETIMETCERGQKLISSS